jgi:hypothetical protein
MNDQKSNRRRLDEINDMWAEDGPIDVADLLNEEARQFRIHGKYQSILTTERRKLRKMQTDAETFRFSLLRFYRDGATDRDQLEYAQQRGWAIPASGKPHVKTDLKHWVDTNNEMVEIMLELAEQQDLVETLEGIMEAIKGRGFSVNAAVKMKVHDDGG